MSTLINFSRTPLPNTQFEGDLDDLLDFLVAHMAGTLENGAITGQVGGSEPLSDIGFWFNGSFYAWNSIVAKYLPIPLVAGRIFNGSLFTTFLQSTASANRALNLPDKSGTLATTDDVFGNQPTQTLVGNAAVNLDARSNTRFYMVLIANVILTPINHVDGDLIEIFVEQTSGNSFDITWASTIHWMGAAPTMSTSASGHRTVDHYKIYRVAGILFGECLQGADILVAGGDTTPPVGAAGSSHYQDIITLLYNEPLRGGSFNVADFTVKYNGIAQTIQTASANGNAVTLNMLNAAATNDVVQVSYSGTGIKDIAGNSAATYINAVILAGTTGSTGAFGGQNGPSGPIN